MSGHFPMFQTKNEGKQWGSTERREQNVRAVNRISLGERPSGCYPGVLRMYNNSGASVNLHIEPSRGRLDCDCLGVRFCLWLRTVLSCNVHNNDIILYIVSCLPQYPWSWCTSRHTYWSRDIPCIPFTIFLWRCVLDSICKLIYNISKYINIFRIT